MKQENRGHSAIAALAGQGIGWGRCCFYVQLMKEQNEALSVKKEPPAESVHNMQISVCQHHPLYDSLPGISGFVVERKLSKEEPRVRQNCAGHRRFHVRFGTDDR